MNINNKKGMTTAGIFLVMGVILVSIITLGLWVFFSDTINTALMSVDGLIGQVNMSEAVSSTWGQFDSGLKNSANLMGIMLIFGLFLGMLAVSYFNRGKRPVLMFILDIIIIFVAFIFAGYIADSYALLIGISDFNTAFVQNMNLVSKLMLNLPIVVLIFGILTMIISYMGIPIEREEQVAGY